MMLAMVVPLGKKGLGFGPSVFTGDHSIPGASRAAWLALTPVMLGEPAVATPVPKVSTFALVPPLTSENLVASKPDWTFSFSESAITWYPAGNFWRWTPTF